MDIRIEEALEKEFNDTRIHLIDQITDTLNIEENSLLHIFTVVV